MNKIQEENKFKFKNEEKKQASSPPEHQIKGHGELIGDIIREAREKRHFSIQIVTQRTKILSSNLESLESNDLASLPNKAYVKGYVKSCARMLGLDEEQCLDILEANYYILEKPQRIKKRQTIEKEKKYRESNQMMMKIVGGVVTAVILISLAINSDSDSEIEQANLQQKKLAEQVQSIEPQVLSEATPLKNKVAPMATETEVSEVLPNTQVEAGADSTIAGQEGQEEQKENPDKAKKIVLRPIRGNLYTLDKDVTTDQMDEWLPTNYRYPLDEETQIVFINALNGDSWLTYQKDRGDIKRFVLNQGKKLVIRGKEVLLLLGNDSATKVFLNNQLLAFNSKTGVKSFVFPETQKKDFYYPLFIFNKDGTVLNSRSYKDNLNND